MLRIWRLRCSRCEHVQGRNLVSGRIVLGSMRPVNENHRRGAPLTVRQMPPNAIRMAPANNAGVPAVPLERPSPSQEDPCQGQTPYFYG